MAEIFNFHVQDNRSIQFPKGNLLEPIMQEDHKVATWRFRIPKVLNNIDMSAWTWWFVYVNAKGQEYSELLTLIDDTDEPASYSTADYDIDYGISKFPGSFSFALEAISAEQGGEISGEWHTKTYKHKVISTLQGNQAQYAETESDIISTLLVEVRMKVNSLVGGATPEPAQLKSNMTDHDKVYLYVGSESGENPGYWYYYNGTDFVPGGLYASGITVDATPTQGSSNAVSSGGVYDALEGINEIVTVNHTKRTNNLYNWRNGYVNLTINSAGKLVESRNFIGVFAQIPIAQRTVIRVYGLKPILDTISGSAKAAAVFENTPTAGSTRIVAGTVSNDGDDVVTELTPTASNQYAFLGVNLTGNSTAEDRKRVARHILTNTIIGYKSSGYALPYADYKEIDVNQLLIFDSEPVENSENLLNSGALFNDKKIIDLKIQNVDGGVSYFTSKRSVNLYNRADGYKNWGFSNGKIASTNNGVAIVVPISSGRHVFRVDDCADIISAAQSCVAKFIATYPQVGDDVIAGTSVKTETGYYGVINQNSAGYAIVAFYFGATTKENIIKYANEITRKFIIAPLPVESGYNLPYTPYFVPVVSKDNLADEVIDMIDANTWQGKKIWWCGTSIPAGKDASIGSESTGKSYPEIVGELLGATVINQALGSSMCRANVRTGDYVNALSHNLILSLSQTIEEKQYLIDNWATIRQSLYDPDTYASLSSVASDVIGSSFESKLTPYLDGTYEMPDLFVFDHGHNDWKTWYTMPDGTTPDTDLQPTVSNISNNILAEDAYMTANSNAKLISIYGEISAIPQSKRAEFIASVNRNCFIGAVNFLCTYILSKNPRARIVFIGNLDNWQKPQVQPAQESLSESWEFPLIKMWEYTGFSEHYIPNTAKLWDASGTSDLTMKKIYCKDGVHPHSDTTGTTVQMYADIIANALRSMV